MARSARLARVHRRSRALVALSALVFPFGAHHPHPGILPPLHPAANVAPSPNFAESCRTNAFDNSTACAVAIVEATDAARAGEDVGPLHFSVAKFLSQSRAVQLFVLTNLEREDRGLPVFNTLSTHLDAIAMRSALADADPVIAGSHATLPGGATIVAWGGNLANNTYNTLASSYFWMYEDGPGAYNLGCAAVGDSGCWAHRLNILGSYPRAATNCAGYPIQRAMGAAATLAGSPAVPSITTLFVAACGSPDSDAVITWTAAAKAVGA